MEEHEYNYPLDPDRYAFESSYPPLSVTLLLDGSPLIGPQDEPSDFEEERSKPEYRITWKFADIAIEMRQRLVALLVEDGHHEEDAQETANQIPSPEPFNTTQLMRIEGLW